MSEPMHTDQLQMQRDREHVKHWHGWYLLAVALCVLSVVLKQPLVFVAAVFALMVGLVPHVWYLLALRHLSIHQQFKQQHVLFGEEAVLALTIENQKRLPLPWLRIAEQVTPGLTILNEHDAQRNIMTQITSTGLLWSYQRVTRYYSMRCYARGLYTFGLMQLKSSDPFGWLEREIILPTHETLIVYPLVVPVETLGFSSISPFGDSATRRYLLEDPLRFAGVRNYQIGDDPRRIHWKAMAHAGNLSSKIYEYSSSNRLLLLLDTWNYSPGWLGTDRELQEFCITVAASLAMWALSQGYRVGLLTNSAMMLPKAQASVTKNIFQEQVITASELSTPGVSVPFALDVGHYERLLTTLGSLAPDLSAPLAHVIDAEEHMFSSATTIVLISARKTLHETTMECLLHWRKRGAAIHLALTGNLQDKCTLDTYDLPVSYLGGSEKWHELIRTSIDGKHESGLTSSSVF